jgi:hypothetical protein
MIKKRGAQLKDYSNFIGQKFGMLTILEITRQLNAKGNNKAIAICKCDCGNIHKAILMNVIVSKSTNCGCKHRVDILGKRFGKLLVIEQFKNERGYLAKCLCDCGTIVCYRSSWVNTGRVLSCKCSNGDAKQRV